MCAISGPGANCSAFAVRLRGNGRRRFLRPTQHTFCDLGVRLDTCTFSPRSIPGIKLEFQCLPVGDVASWSVSGSWQTTAANGGGRGPAKSLRTTTPGALRVGDRGRFVLCQLAPCSFCTRLSAQPCRHICSRCCRPTQVGTLNGVSRESSSRAINLMAAAAFVALVLAQSADVTGAFWSSS